MIPGTIVFDEVRFSRVNVEGKTDDRGSQRGNEKLMTKGYM